MRRLGRLAPVLAAAALALRAAPAAAEPLDVSLARLGPPEPRVWAALDARAGGPGDAATAEARARDARRRFAILSGDVALAMTSALLEPASTTGASGFDLSAELADSAVHDGPVGTPALGFTDRPWATISERPGAVMASGLHLRKALPFSVELGGRLTNLLQTSYLAAQGEVKVALHEGFEAWPDVAVRLAYTKLLGARDWDLATTDLDLLVSKRWGVAGMTSLTPYLGARFSFLDASSNQIAFAAPADATPTSLLTVSAAFPALRALLYRTTVGVRLTASALSLAVEGTYFAGTTPSTSAYAGAKLAATLSGAFKAGLEW